MTINISVPKIDENDLKPRISVIGVGGAGGNAVNNMIRSNLEGVDFLVTNTDSQALKLSLADHKIQLGPTVTQGLGAGSRPDVGRAAAEEVIEEIMSQITKSNMVFITAGMGGGTGSGAAPVIAQAAREAGILTIGVVTKPFHFEGQHRMRIAEQGIEELAGFVDTLIIIPNQNLFRIANEKTTFAEAFTMADDVLHSGVRGVTDLMIMPGLINLDFADIRTVMSEMGKAMMGTGEAEGEHRAVAAAESAINNPLLEDASMKGARGVLINITGGADMTLYEVDEAANRIREEVDPDANIIFGSAFDESMHGTMRVSVVATGIAAENSVARPRPALSLVQARASKVASVAAEQAAAREPVGTTAQAVPAAAPAVAASAAPATSPAIAEAPMADVVEPSQDTLLIDDDALAPVEAPAAAQAQAPTEEASIAAPRHDAYITPPPIMPIREPATSKDAVRAESAPSGRERAIDPMRAAEMANAGGRTSLIQRVTGLALGGRSSQPAPAPKPEARADSETASAPKPASPAQPRLGSLDLADRATPSKADDDLLEIPAFLRRQAN